MTHLTTGLARSIQEQRQSAAEHARLVAQARARRVRERREQRSLAHAALARLLGDRRSVRAGPEPEQAEREPALE